MATDSAFANQSVYASGTVTAPAANTVFATIPAGSLPKGFYHIRVKVGFGGVVDPTAANVNNFQITRGGTNIAPGGLAMPLLANLMHEHVFERVYFDGSQSCALANMSASGAGGVYLGSVCMTMVQ